MSSLDIEIKVLLEEIQNSSSSKAFSQLFLKFRPLVNFAINNFQFRHYEVDDLLQEARIVCYQSALTFNTNNYPLYGAYFKKSLFNRFNSLLRYDLSHRRATSKADLSYDQFYEEHAAYFHTHLKTELDIDTRLAIEEILPDIPVIFSDLEYQIFNLYCIQDRSVKEIAQLLEMKEMAIYGAINRCRKKMNSLKINRR